MAGPRRDYTEEDYKKIKKENKKKLDKILANPNFQEYLGRKYYGEGWRVTLYGNHPEKFEAKQTNQARSYNRYKGDGSVGFVVRWNARPVNQYELDGTLIRKWKSSLEWCEVNNEPIRKANTLVKAARGKGKTGFGFIWKFENKEDREANEQIKH